MKKIFKKLQTAEGWPKLNILFGFLVTILFFTIISQLFIDKEVTLWQVVKNGFSGKYEQWQYIFYGLYIIFKMLVIIMPTIGAAILIRMINHNNTLNVKDYRTANIGTIIILFLWVVSLLVSYIYKVWFEGEFLSIPEPGYWEAHFQMYEIMLPALALTFIDNTFTEISRAKKIFRRKKLSPVVENKLVKIFSEGNLTENEQLHLLRNLEKQTNNYLEHKH